MNFNRDHGTAIPKNDFNQNIDCESIKNVNTRILGGGASQNFVAFKLLENYIAYEKPEYVVEIGSQKGGLSVYLGTIACVAEQFLFHTFDITKSDWNNRAHEGAGHWFEKMESICPFCKSFESDIFSKYSYNLIFENIKKYKTLIICDGGNKAKEVYMYSSLLKSGDMIMAHDFGHEIFDQNINYNILQPHEPFNQRFIDNKTLFKTFVRI
jgi:cephalosporin hydroxylase